MRFPLSSHVRVAQAARTTVVCLAALFLSLSVVAPAAAQDAPEIPITEAMRHVGETVTVCGRVASAAHFANVNGRPTFLNLDRPYPDQLFTVVIWGQSRSRFDTPPERLYDGKLICVSGEIETYKGRPQIEVKSPEQIALRESEPETGGLSHLESIFVKAVLSALGHEANYGSSEWDQETVEALISFQESAGIEPTGDPDAATLRALAADVPGLSEDDAEMVIRLFLFELARRAE